MAAAIHTLPYAIEEESDAEYDRDYRDAQPLQRDATPANTFGMVPVSLYGLVDHGAVAVYAAIASHAKPNGYASPSIGTITKLIKTISRPTVMKHVKALADAGAIVINEHRRGSTRSFEYFLPLHPPVKKLDRSDIIDNHTGQEFLPVTGQRTLPVDAANNRDRSKNFTGDRSKIFTGEKTTGQKTLPVPVKDFDRNKNKEINDDMPSETAAPQPESKTPSRVFQIADWYAKRIGGVLPGKGAREWAHAKQLAATPITDDELGELFDWLMGQSWVDSVSLSLMASKYNEWRSSKQAKPKKRAYNDPRNANGFVG